MSITGRGLGACRQLMREGLGLVLLAAAALFGLSASAAADTLKDRFSELYKAASQEGEVVFLSDGREDAARRLSDFWKQNFPDVQLKITPNGAPAIVSQVEAERKAGQYREDVVQISLMNVAVDWKKRGLYEPYKATTISKYLPDNADPDGAFYSDYLVLLPAAYNTKAFPDKQGLPTSLKDFLDPKWKGKIVLPDPVTSGNTQIFLMTMLSKGLIDWDWLQKLAQQDVLFVRGNPDAVRMIASGERTVTPLLTYLNIQPAKKKGQPVDYYILDEGAIISQGALGVMAKAPHPNAAKLLVEALLSPEGQAAFAGDGAFFPADPSVKVKGAPDIASMKTITPPPPSDNDKQDLADFIGHFKKVFNRQ
jgi:iron(III) transport system substrate-binding protein